MLLVALIACTSTPDSSALDSVVESPARDSAGPEWMEATEPTWGASEVEAALNANLATGLGEPVSLREWWLGVLARYQAVQGDEWSTCGLSMVQIHTEDELASAWFGPCTAIDGGTVDGGWIHSESWRQAEDGEQFSMNLLTSMRVEDPSGAESVSGGQVAASVTRNGQDLSFDYSFGGDYDLGVDEGVLAHPVGGGLFVEGSRELGVLSAQLDGGLRHEELSLYFHEVVLDPELCEGFTGRVQVRDPSSAWLDWSLDCSTCGPLSYEGEELGEVCAGEALKTALLSSVDALGRVQRW